jgi:hypothetical protein
MVGQLAENAATLAALESAIADMKSIAKRLEMELSVSPPGDKEHSDHDLSEHSDHCLSEQSDHCLSEHSDHCLSEHSVESKNDADSVQGEADADPQEESTCSAALLCAAVLQHTTEEEEATEPACTDSSPSLEEEGSGTESPEALDPRWDDTTMTKEEDALSRAFAEARAHLERSAQQMLQTMHPKPVPAKLTSPILW